MIRFLKGLLKDLLYLALAIAVLAAYPVWNALTWTQRLEAAATETIEIPGRTHNVVELQGFGERSRMIADLAVGEGVTVAVRHKDDPSHYTGFTAASGPVCDGPGAVFRPDFVMLGFYDSCLLREEIPQPDDAMILRLLHEHKFRKAGWGGGLVVWRLDPVAPMEGDDAWMMELAERSGGQERLLGRAVTTELKGEDGKPVVPYWPSFPERVDQIRRSAEDSAAYSRLSEQEKHAFRPQGTITFAKPFYGTVQNLSYAMLDRGLGRPIDGAWQALGEPDPLRAMDFAEALVFSGSDPEAN